MKPVKYTGIRESPFFVLDYSWRVEEENRKIFLVAFIDLKNCKMSVDYLKFLHYQKEYY